MKFLQACFLMAHLYSVHKVSGEDVCLIVLISLLCCDQWFPLFQEAETIIPDSAQDKAGRQEKPPHAAFLERYYFLPNFPLSFLHHNFKWKALHGVQTNTSPYVETAHWGTEIPLSIPVDLAQLWGLGIVMQGEAPLGASRTLGSNQEVTVGQLTQDHLVPWADRRRRAVFVQPTGSGMVLSSFWGAWKKQQQSSGPELENTRRIWAFPITEGRRKLQDQIPAGTLTCPFLPICLVHGSTSLRMSLSTCYRLCLSCHISRSECSFLLQNYSHRTLCP